MSIYAWLKAVAQIPLHKAGLAQAKRSFVQSTRPAMSARRSRRLLRREQLFAMVRESMIRAGVISTSAQSRHGIGVRAVYWRRRSAAEQRGTALKSAIPVQMRYDTLPPNLDSQPGLAQSATQTQRPCTTHADDQIETLEEALQTL